MTERLVLFFDWQNIYRRAREAFEGNIGPSHKGQSDPIDLAHVIAKKHAARFPDLKFELTQIRIYRGRPTQQNDPRGYAAFQRQVAQWGRSNKVRPRFNDLRYPPDWGDPDCDLPREKGIDVALAVDLVSMAHRGDMDAAVVMSADYDLLPAIEEVASNGSGSSVSVAAWKGQSDGRPLRLRRSSGPLWCYWLEQADYWASQDTTNYTVPVARTSGPIPRPPPLR